MQQSVFIRIIKMKPIQNLRIGFTDFGERSMKNCREKIFDEVNLYLQLEKMAQENKLQQIQMALPFARESHKGQYRDGSEKIPYIYHPLCITHHAWALGYREDTLLAAILLHDVCEDCVDIYGENIKPEALPVSKEAQEIVRLVTKPKIEYSGWIQDYYRGISTNHDAMLVKILDRCNNISTMAHGFRKEKIRKYIIATEKYLLPLWELYKLKYGEKEREKIFLLEYQMLSMLETIKRFTVKEELCI